MQSNRGTLLGAYFRKGGASCSKSSRDPRLLSLMSAGYFTLAVMLFNSKMRKEEGIMKRLFVVFIGLFAGVSLIGYAASAKEAVASGQSENSGVFTEVTNGGGGAQGLAELTIKADLKRHVKGYYLFEAKESKEGQQKYPFLVDVDGQAARWEAEGYKDIKPKYDVEGKTSRDPEASEGIKYVLSKKIRLRAGTHKVLLSLPEDGYSTQVEISLKEGETGVLEFRPVYRTKSIPTRIPTFLNGINKYEVFLNGKQIS